MSSLAQAKASGSLSYSLFRQQQSARWISLPSFTNRRDHCEQASRAGIVEEPAARRAISRKLDVDICTRPIQIVHIGGSSLVPFQFSRAPHWAARVFLCAAGAGATLTRPLSRSRRPTMFTISMPGRSKPGRPGFQFRQHGPQLPSSRARSNASTTPLPSISAGQPGHAPQLPSSKARSKASIELSPSKSA